MKSLITALFLILAISTLKAQNVYNNNINEVKELKITSPNANVSIGKVIVTKTLKPKIILTGYSQTTDTANTYKTIFNLESAEHLPYFNPEIILQFNAPIDFVLANFNGTANFPSTQYNADKTAARFSALQVNAQYGSISLVVVSKTKIFTTISGIDSLAVH